MSYFPCLPASTAKSKQTEIDFGAALMREGIFVVTDADVTAASKLEGNVAYVATVDHLLDDIQCDAFDCKFAPGVGQFTLYIRALIGAVAGKYKINYTVSVG